MLKALNHPGRLIPVLFCVVLTLGTALLCLPISRVDPEGAPNVLAAAFTAVSATCVTGLAVVDTATYWTPFGQVVIMGLIQVGGIGIMTLATMLAILVSGKVGLRQSLVAKAESQALQLGDVGSLIRTIALAVASIEATITLLLAARYMIGYGYSPGSALWHGLFHTISGFNNVGYSLDTDNLIPYNQDPFVILPLLAAIISGGLGFPVYDELRRRWRQPSHWSMHTRVTLIGYATLFVVGVVGFGLSEWDNPATLGPMSTPGKLLNSLAGGVVPRTGGYNTIDYNVAHPQTWALTDLLMFVGGGSAGTSGGIKVSTFALLGFVIWAEIRGEPDVVIGRRMVPQHVQREAITVVLLALVVVVMATAGMLVTTSQPLDRLVFEVISAFGTTGLSTGITPSLPGIAQLILMATMYLGRVGTVTTASALALNRRHRHYRLPEERPIIG